MNTASVLPSLGAEGPLECVRMVASAALYRGQAPDNSRTFDVRLMPTVEELQKMEQPLPTVAMLPFRHGIPLHNLLLQPAHCPLLQTPAEVSALPGPVFPQHPELVHELDAADIAAHGRVLNTGKRYRPASKILKTMKEWVFPYLKFRVLPGDFQPIIAYLFVEWKCNLDCHYCWPYDNRVKGMTETTAYPATTGLSPSSDHRCHLGPPALSPPSRRV